MKKIVIILDPNQKNLRNMKDFPKISEKRKDVIFWFGCSTASFFHSLKQILYLKKNGLKKFTLFPGRVKQAFAGGWFCEEVVVYDLLNVQNRLDKKVKLGKIIFEIMRIFFPKKKLKLGYLVLHGESSVGKRSKAKKITTEEAIKKIKKYMNTEKDTWGICIEAGSGTIKSADPQMIKEISEILKQKSKQNNKKYKLMVTGGIKTPEKMIKLFENGADLIGISTSLEQDSVEKSNKEFRKFLGALDKINRRLKK